MTVMTVLMYFSKGNSTLVHISQRFPKKEHLGIAGVNFFRLGLNYLAPL